MSKGKLQKFAEMQTFPNVLQPPFEEVFENDFRLKGKWNTAFFNKDQELVLELGCGKGEYTLGLARKYSNRNFLGIDIKGARIWKGAKAALEANITNAGFLRARIDFINSFFATGEVSEIWITFPDPQPKKVLKRLTSSRFLNRYRSVLVDKGFINLKTDSKELFDYTLMLAEFNNLEIEVATRDLYNSGYDNEILSIRTFYETMWMAQGISICYLRFKLPGNGKIQELPEQE